MTPLLLATAEAVHHAAHTLPPMDFGRLMFYLFILVLAGFLGFAPKAYFEAQPGAAVAPKVTF